MQLTYKVELGNKAKIKERSRAAVVEEFRSRFCVYGGGGSVSQVEVSEWTLLGCPGGGVMEEGLGLSCQLLLACRQKENAEKFTIITDIK